MTKETEETLEALPAEGFVFWPVGNGDSTTIVVSDDIVVQVDLHHAEESSDEEYRAPVVDRLVELLPKRDGKPYLAAFVLTHPDKDHCLGFQDLLERVTIGELWHTPRVFREYKEDLCDDAIAFQDEAKRRAKVMKRGSATSGDRVRLVGYDDLLTDDPYDGFPEDKLTIPGNAVSEIDGEDCGDSFRAFVHAPFKDDSSGERNETSLALQVALSNGGATARAMLLGDLSCPTISRIFEESDDDDLLWDILLAPHHCSKSAMYWRDGEEEEETLRTDVLDALEASAGDPGIVIASSMTVPAKNKSGDNPPHAKAKARYEERAPGGFYCTADEAPAPIVCELSGSGLSVPESRGHGEGSKGIRGAVAAARGTGDPPKDRVGFGKA